MTDSHSLAGRTVLVVDDEPATRELLNLVLSERGFTVSGAGTPSEALESCRRDQPTIVLIDADFSAPKGGLRLLADLRVVRPGVHLCLVSGGADCTVEELEELGVAAFFNKPFTMNQLVQKLESLCSSPQ